LAEKELVRNWRGDSILDVRRSAVGFHMGNIGLSMLSPELGTPSVEKGI